MDNALFESKLHSLEPAYRGKVRDLYVINDESLLMVDSDRLSAFDQVFEHPIPGKGKILTALSRFWFEKMSPLVPHHLLPMDPLSVVSDDEKPLIQGRSAIVKRLRPIRIESVVRGYLTGSAWKDYEKEGHVNGLFLPPGLSQTHPLPEPIWTPSIKISDGGHDQSCSYEDVCSLIGKEKTDLIRTLSLRIYQNAFSYTSQRNIILLDTKMEFGSDEKTGSLYLMDELLTPDCSRYWLKKSPDFEEKPYHLDKQYIRDYWTKTCDSRGFRRLPSLPKTVIEEFIRRYQMLYDIILGDGVNNVIATY